MRKIPYIDYDKLDGFHAVQEVARMFRMNIRNLAAKGQQYDFILIVVIPGAI